MTFLASMLRMSAGIWVWALHFTVIYAFTALACARALPPGAVIWTVSVATLVAAAACLGIARAGLRRVEHFESWMSAALAGLALLGVVWQGLPVLMVPICA